nr:immunoglobulin heavy chain junction region [Mus musculus]
CARRAYGSSYGTFDYW